MPPQLADASWDDVVRAVAKQHQVNPALALAVAKKESNVTPGVKGDSGKATGMFQLHAGAAADTGVDPTDPLQNITGGVKYLKQLSERYQGDLSKTLQAYNGGMDAVDKGTVSPAAQAYAAEVLANLSAGMRETAAPGAAAAPATPAAAGIRPPIAGRGTATQNVGVQAQQNAIDFTRAYDPRTTEGRENLAGTAGSIALTAATRGMPVGALTTRIASVLGPVLGAATMGAGERAVEEQVGTAPSSGGSVTGAAARQGAYDLAGQVFLWPIQRIGRTLLAPKVAANAAEGLKLEAESTRQAGRSAVDLVRSQVEDVVRTTKLAAQQAVDSVKTTARGMIRGTKQSAAAQLAQTEADHAALVADVSKQYDNLLNHVPSTSGTAAAVKATVEGPSKRALDLAGQRVAEAAASGPEISIKPVKDAVNAMGEQARPASIFGQPDAVPGIGFLRNVASNVQGAAASIGNATAAESANFKAMIAKQLGIEETHPLPGLLGKIQQAPDTIAFADAHQLKMLLDEAVNWDRVAKKSLERVTKGTRIALRETMAAAGHQPYEAATAAYHAVIPLYRKGIGKQIIQLSQTPAGSARIAQLLKANDPISARSAKQLLVDQAAAGGDAELGHKAWDAVRSSYTYENVIRGGVDKLGDRLSKLLTERPEFVKEVYGDEAGTNVLHNLGALAEAFSHAEAQAAEQIATTKATGKTAIEGAVEAGQQSVETAKRGASAAVADAQRAGAGTVRVANRQAAAANAGVKAKTEAFKQSSIAKFTRTTPESEGADIVRAAALGLRSYWGGMSLLRLLRSPHGADLLQWMAYSPANTQRAVRIMTSPVPPAVASAFFKDVYNAFPSASTATAAGQ